MTLCSGAAVAPTALSGTLQTSPGTMAADRDKIEAATKGRFRAQREMSRLSGEVLVKTKGRILHLIPLAGNTNVQEAVPCVVW